MFRGVDDVFPGPTRIMKRRVWEQLEQNNETATKVVRIDKGAMTLKKIMSAVVEVKEVPPPSLILCESCHKRAPPAEKDACASALILVGECRFCSRRSLCAECWTTCMHCGLEICPLCSVKDYSGRCTSAVCLDCKRYAQPVGVGR